MTFPNALTFFKFTLFADDNTISYDFKISPTDDISNIISNELLFVDSWLVTNKI